MKVVAEKAWDWFLFEDDGKLYLEVLVEHGAISFSVTSELSPDHADAFRREGATALDGIAGEMRHKGLMRAWTPPALPAHWAARSTAAVHEWQRRHSEQEPGNRPVADGCDRHFPAAQLRLMRHSITLNVRYDQPQADWDKVMRVYESMPGWRAAGDQSWFGSESDPQWIWASIEPSGTLFEAQMDYGAWSQWIGELCDRLTFALGRPIHDAES